MIAAIASRDSDNVALVFAKGTYEFGLLDAGLAGTATLTINETASTYSDAIVKPGSRVHIFPQASFDHWYGLISSQPVYNPQQRVYTIHVIETHGYLSDIQVASAR